MEGTTDCEVERNEHGQLHCSLDWPSRQPQLDYEPAALPRNTTRLHRMLSSLTNILPNKNRPTMLTSGQVEEREVPDRLAGGCNRCCTGLPCRNRRPHHYLESVWEYVPYAPGGVANPVYRHRDASRRTTKKRLTDRYLHHQDGRLRNLIVAASDDIWAMALSGRNETTWRRTYVRKTAPYVVRMASWVIDWTVKRDCGSYTLELCKAFCFMLGMICMVSLSPLYFCIQWEQCLIRCSLFLESRGRRARRMGETTPPSCTSTSATPKSGITPSRTLEVEFCSGIGLSTSTASSSLDTSASCGKLDTVGLISGL